ncbi:DnaJ domain-containing protein [Catenuloplanes sp. NPDC051500]|uniref:DnaJ domain-containing protein n=1 Tax=Catenuloplanes sp. NPDC051500 TaxID=3363959 RepID=UPI0037AE7F01
MSRDFRELGGRDAYALLGLTERADAQEIKRAWRALSRRHHADVGGSDNIQSLLNVAYDTLSDRLLRDEYDRYRRTVLLVGAAGPPPDPSPWRRPPSRPPTREPDARKADAGRPDARQADGGRPDARKADPGRPDARKADGGRADAGRADARKAETRAPRTDDRRVREPAASEPPHREPPYRAPHLREPDLHGPDLRGPDFPASDEWDRWDEDESEHRRFESDPEQGRHEAASSFSAWTAPRQADPRRDFISTARPVGYDNLAIISLVLALVFAPAALITAPMALYRIRRTGAQGRALAITALILVGVLTIALTSGYVIGTRSPVMAR